ncbi:hypothetical protein [Candidatus Poriferisocius sp.]|uniref:hypothetical protein n=1 Tax=Candidatus Poriferisocius sp. TaxID=3101276 RepID=UPI003B5CFD6E
MGGQGAWGLGERLDPWITVTGTLLMLACMIYSWKATQPPFGPYASTPRSRLALVFGTGLGLIAAAVIAAAA